MLKYASKIYISGYISGKKYGWIRGGSGKNPGNVWYIFPNWPKIAPTTRFFPYFGFFPPKFLTPTHIFSGIFLNICEIWRHHLILFAAIRVNLVKYLRKCRLSIFDRSKNKFYRTFSDISHLNMVFTSDKLLFLPDHPNFDVKRLKKE